MSEKAGLSTESGDTATLAAQASSASGKGPPPVHLWNPPFSRDLDMRIARDGTWWHEGSPIKRVALVRLFASILKLEDGRYFLVTPVEKVGITVEDAPFVAVDVEAEAGGLRFTTNVGDTVIAGQDHAIRVDLHPETGEPSPYIHIRRGLEALIDRKSFYRLVDMAEMSGDLMIVRSGGETFELGTVA
jgi:hypothetical protein